jgi:hypothetical protein
MKINASQTYFEISVGAPSGAMHSLLKAAPAGYKHPELALK